MRDLRERQGAERTAGETGFLPNFCALRPAFAVVVGAELLSMVLVLGSERPLALFWSSLSNVSLYVQWVALGGATLLCLAHRWLRGLAHHWCGLAAWGLLMAAAVAVSVGFFVLLTERGLGLYANLGPYPELLAKTLGVTAIVAALMLRYLYLQHQWKRQVLAKSEARLQALEARIRPHFLFNSMNTIASLARTRPELAEEITQDLADLFRQSLDGAGRVSSLGSELQLARQYLNIEALRLGERLQVVWDLQGLPMEAQVPSLVLQPLLENAVYHGVEPALDPGVIRILGRYRKGQVNISIRNTLVQDRTSHRKGNRMALDNIRQRLAGMFEDRASLVESVVEGEYQVRLVFPYRWVEL